MIYIIVAESAIEGMKLEERSKRKSWKKRIADDMRTRREEEPDHAVHNPEALGIAVIYQ